MYECIYGRIYVSIYLLGIFTVSIKSKDDEGGIDAREAILSIKRKSKIKISGNSQRELSTPRLALLLVRKINQFDSVTIDL